MRIAIFGAGSIGCYVGGRLLAGGEDVVFCGRERVAQAIADHGLTLSHYQLPTTTIAAQDVRFATTPYVLADADVILVTVKSQATADSGAEIAASANPRALIVSLQNGVRNAGLLRDVLGDQRVAAGMVPFNVVNQGNGMFHCGTEGELVIERNATTEAVVTRLNAASVGTRTATDMDAVLWGKLLLNLNNALNLLSDRPLKEQLGNRDYRRVLALSIAEGLAVLRDAGIRPARVGKMLPALMPTILRLPDFIFQILARGMLKIDPQARSSMWEDLRAGREAEIDYLNGEITRLGDTRGVPTPVCDRIVSLVREAFANKASPALSGSEILNLVSTRPGNSSVQT